MSCICQADWGGKLKDKENAFLHPSPPLPPLSLQQNMVRLMLLVLPDCTGTTRDEHSTFSFFCGQTVGTERVQESHEAKAQTGSQPLLLPGTMLAV